MSKACFSVMSAHIVEILSFIDYIQNQFMQYRSCPGVKPK